MPPRPPKLLEDDDWPQSDEGVSRVNDTHYAGFLIDDRVVLACDVTPLTRAGVVLPAGLIGTVVSYVNDAPEVVFDVAEDLEDLPPAIIPARFLRLYTPGGPLYVLAETYSWDVACWKFQGAAHHD